MRGFVALTCLLVACSSSKDDDGELGGHCYPNATCNVGLSCSGGVCLVADAAVDAPTLDAAPDAFACPSDPFEPNDNVSNAFATPIASATLTQTVSAGICPAGDKDTFAVTITVMGQNLELLVARPAGDTTIQGSILNSGGTPIANASPLTTNSDTLRGYTPNLPVGTYYVQTYGAPTAMGAHPYTLTITASGP